jgi:hypothetical protein
LFLIKHEGFSMKCYYPYTPIKQILKDNDKTIIWLEYINTGHINSYIKAIKYV